jgi:indole-3-glycerol phosphate synthase
MAVIAELKRSSPSAGKINHNVPLDQAAISYDQHGAAAISVLTDMKYFGGELNDLVGVRRNTALPLLRKDFIIDEYQITEAKAHGADAILLIAAVLDKAQLAELNSCARDHNLEALVELYEERELEKLDFATMKLIGINNRDLHTMSVNIDHTFEIARLLPPGTTIVSESGIASPEDLANLYRHGIHAALVGEHLMKSPDPGDALAELLAPLVAEDLIRRGRATT